MDENCRVLDNYNVSKELNAQAHGISKLHWNILHGNPVNFYLSKSACIRALLANSVWGSLGVDSSLWIVIDPVDKWKAEPFNLLML